MNSTSECLIQRRAQGGAIEDGTKCPVTNCRVKYKFGGVTSVGDTEVGLRKDIFEKFDSCQHLQVTRVEVG